MKQWTACYPTSVNRNTDKNNSFEYMIWLSVVNTGSPLENLPRNSRQIRSRQRSRILNTSELQIVKNFGHFGYTDLFAIFWISKLSKTVYYNRTITNMRKKSVPKFSEGSIFWSRFFKLLFSPKLTNNVLLQSIKML